MNTKRIIPLVFVGLLLTGWHCSSSVEKIQKRPPLQLKASMSTPIKVNPQQFNYQKYFDIALKMYQSSSQEYLAGNRERAIKDVMYALDLVKQIKGVNGLDIWQIANTEELLNSTLTLYEKMVMNIYDEQYDNSHLVVSKMLRNVINSEYSLGNLEKWERFARLGIPYFEDERVTDQIRVLTGGMRPYFEKWIYRSGYYVDWMADSLFQAGLPDELIYLCMIESGFSPFASSSARAVGLWQFMSGTAKIYKLDMNFWVDERRNPDRSTHAAIRHLRDLQDRYNNWYLSMAAYNCGAGRIDRALRRENTGDYWSINRLPKETQKYVPRFLAAMHICRNLEDYGFDPTYKAEPLQYEIFPINKFLKLSTISLALGISEDQLKLLNPELARDYTPPDYKNYPLRLPPDKVNAFAQIYPGLKAEQKKMWFQHKVRRGDNVWKISRKYGVSQQTILQLNKLTKRSVLKLGQTLLIPMEVK